MANMTVGEIRRRFRTRLDLDPESQAVLDVPWIPAGLSVREASKRIYRILHGSARQYQTARDVALAIVAENAPFNMGLRGPAHDPVLDYLEGPF
ncbi:MAG: hypothetical protein QHJ82_10545 [Verrucomicrobiota bacterium]|nr:hypothetical protein [Verrucomicrobiota bacterium]